jgi:putative endonuclease
MKSNHRRSLGRYGESLAAVFLEKKGYKILERNYRTPYGEIDLVALINEVITFVEVKTRASRSLGPPEISITPRKEEHMRGAAEYYIQQHPEILKDWCVDVVTIQVKKDGSAPVIDHFENVIT